MKCPDCNGTGQYVGPFETDRCKTCSGEALSDFGLRFPIIPLKELTTSQIINRLAVILASFTNKAKKYRDEIENLEIEWKKQCRDANSS